MFARRERALSEITECAAQPQNEQASESEDDSDELQNRAVTLLSEFCKKADRRIAAEPDKTAKTTAQA